MTSPQFIPWSSQKKVTFRFFFLFFGLFIAIENNGAYPFWNTIMSYPTKLLHSIVPWMGKHILNLPNDISTVGNGSGDTTYDYLIMLLIFSVSLLGTLLWSIVDRQSVDYSRLYYWLTVAIRFYVGLMLFNYGLVKIIKLQFPDPSLYRLMQNYGDSSPMGLAWTFLGFSRGYNIFMGMAEVSAVLLLFRRTMTLGALIALATAANVMAVNYFFDVPVKILSSVLVLMVLFLLAKDAGPLWKFFLTNGNASLNAIKVPEFSRNWMPKGKLLLKTLIITYAVITRLIGVADARKVYGDLATKPYLYGIYDVDLFVSNGDTIAPLTTKTDRWHQFIVQYEGHSMARMMDFSNQYFASEIDTVGKTLDLKLAHDTSTVYNLNFQVLDSTKIHLSGIMNQDSVIIHMSRRDPTSFRLTNRGFHWINEYPFNR